MSGLWIPILKVCVRISMRVGKVSYFLAADRWICGKDASLTLQDFFSSSIFSTYLHFFSKLEHTLVFANSFNSLKFL